jgi:hypothetical protein|tara:strand:+ start:2442 stop:2804 length:363 start_codon:yes stop_codon:yes gene_type:complete
MKIALSSVVVGVVVGVAAWKLGWLDSLMASKSAEYRADFIATDAPPTSAIKRNEGSVSQVMTDVQLLGGQAVGQNMTNYGVSDATGMNGNVNNPAMAAYVNRATVVSFGQNFNGRTVGLN